MEPSLPIRRVSRALVHGLEPWAASADGRVRVTLPDLDIPLLSHAYPGNKTEVTQFATMIDELFRRHRVLGGEPDALTVVFDAGHTGRRLGWRG